MPEAAQSAAQAGPREIVRSFVLEGTPIQCVPFGSGHINNTWLVITNRPHLYILQRVNTSVFPDGEGLMRNIQLVTAHLRSKDPDPRKVLTLIPTRDGDLFLHPGEGEYWRVYEYITGGICLERAESPRDLMLSGKAFGQFQHLMADFPSGQLTEVIPGFHYTPGRYRKLREALRKDPCGRAASARPELDFYLAREEAAGLLMSMLREGSLPLRVTHNDTKLNNVILDEVTMEPLCILDLDTVMPGLVASDFGDAVRFGASTAAEDEPRTELVHVDLSLYEAYARGFVGACGSMLTPAELETLPDGARLITLENGVRFLTDYLEGDHYFHTDRPDQNLDRARTQIALVREMEQGEDEIRRMMNRVRAETVV